MKKIFTLLIMASSIFMAYAFEWRAADNRPLLKKGESLTNEQSQIKYPTRADESETGTLEFSYADGVYSYVGYRENITYYACIEIPEELSSLWKGNQITYMEFAYGGPTSRRVDVLIYKDLNADPVYSQRAGKLVSKNWTPFKFATPYEINGEKFYIGYQVTNALASESPIGVDGLYTENECADIVLLTTSTGEKSVQHIGDQVGSNSIIITIEGNIPTNCASPASISLPNNITPDTPFNCQFSFKNYGGNEISSLEVNVKVGDKLFENPSISLTSKVGVGEIGTATISGLYSPRESDKVPVEITVTKVNGEDNNYPADPISSHVPCFTDSYSLNVLVEEFTGTWCGYCPRGIVGMEYMAANYQDKGFIGVAVHDDDDMESTSYHKVVEAFASGFPEAVVNRKYLIDPSQSALVNYYNIVSKLPSYGKIDATATYYTTQKILEVTGNAEFSIDITNGTYGMAFAIKEDKVGPYAQQNFYSNNPSAGNLKGWSDAASSVMTIYNEVGRVIVDPFGIDGSIPEVISKGESYTYTTKVPTSSVKDINNCKVVAMILDTETYEVVNSVQTEIAYDTTGVEGIEENTKEEVFKVYNPQGIKVLETKDTADFDNLAKGIYIINGKKVKL